MPILPFAELGAFLSWESETFSARLLPMVLKELARVPLETLPLAAVRPSHMASPYVVVDLIVCCNNVKTSCM